MRGQLELGSMVAFLSAQEKIYTPWKELIEFYQVYQDASVRYQRTMKIFDIPHTNSLTVKRCRPLPMNGAVESYDVGYTGDKGKTLLQQVSFTLKSGQHLALVGFSGSGKSTLVQCISKILSYTNGPIKLGGIEVKDLDKNELVKHVGYISQNPFIFSGSVLDNILYAHSAAYDQAIIGNKTYLPPSLDHLILCLQQAGVFVNVIRFGLETNFELSTPAVSSKIVTMRRKFRDVSGPSLEQYIEFYDPHKYLKYSTILDNIAFSVSKDPNNTIDALLDRPTFISFLRNQNIMEMLLRIGTQIAKHSIEMHVALQDGESKKNFHLSLLVIH